MTYSVDVLLRLRNATLDTYFDALVDGDTNDADLDAISC